MAPGIETACFHDGPGFGLNSVTIIKPKLIQSPPHGFNPESAAAQKIVISLKEQGADAPANALIISSPYTAERHLLDLTTLDKPNQLFAIALTTLKAIRPDYATADYVHSFNWDGVLGTLRDLIAAENLHWQEQSFYVVIFRSQLKLNTDRDLLYELDAHSHEEAVASGGLLKYWFGIADEQHRNLATCLWRNRTDARLGGTGPWHARARLAARDMYARIDFSTHRFTISEGAESWKLEPWKSENANNCLPHH